MYSGGKKRNKVIPSFSKSKKTNARETHVIKESNRKWSAWSVVIFFAAPAAACSHNYSTAQFVCFAAANSCSECTHILMNSSILDGNNGQNVLKNYKTPACCWKWLGSDNFYGSRSKSKSPYHSKSIEVNKHTVCFHRKGSQRYVDRIPKTIYITYTSFNEWLNFKQLIKPKHIF